MSNKERKTDIGTWSSDDWGVKFTRHPNAAGPPIYEIDWERLKNPDGLETWMWHLEEKTWITKSDLAALVSLWVDHFLAQKPTTSW